MLECGSRIRMVRKGVAKSHVARAAKERNYRRGRELVEQLGLAILDGDLADMEE